MLDALGTHLYTFETGGEIGIGVACPDAYAESLQGHLNKPAGSERMQLRLNTPNPSTRYTRCMHLLYNMQLICTLTRDKLRICI